MPKSCFARPAPPRLKVGSKNEPCRPPACPASVGYVPEASARPAFTVIVVGWVLKLRRTPGRRPEIPNPRLDYSMVAPCFADAPSMPLVAHAAELTPHFGRSRPTDPGGTLREALVEHARVVGETLRLATELGSVVIVTMAEVGFVHRIIKNYLPSLAGVLEALRVEVVYARTFMQRRYLRGAQLDGLDLRTVLKTKAVSRTLKAMSSSTRVKPNCCWALYFLSPRSGLFMGTSTPCHSCMPFHA